MNNIRIVTEEELPKLKNIYYNFGTKELKVGDSVGVKNGVRELMKRLKRIENSLPSKIQEN
jgi:hypothetical protein